MKFDFKIVKLGEKFTLKVKSTGTFRHLDINLQYSVQMTYYEVKKYTLTKSKKNLSDYRG